MAFAIITSYFLYSIILLTFIPKLPLKIVFRNLFQFGKIRIFLVVKNVIISVYAVFCRACTRTSVLANQNIFLSFFISINNNGRFLYDTDF